MTQQAYLHFGGAFCNERGGPMQTVKVEWRESPLVWQTLGLSYTASGYGNRIPSPYMVKWCNRWRRVYICQQGNAGTAYIGPWKAPLATVDSAAA
jgi:hypothetical protein